MRNSLDRPACRATWQILSIALAVAGTASLAPAQAPEGSSATDSETLHFTEKDLPSSEKDPGGPSEIDDFARSRGFRYARDTRRAARGDFKALKKFFEIAQDADGAAAESIAGMPTVVYHLLGDEKFATFLGTQPVAYRMMVRNLILGGGIMPVETLKFSREFPASARLLLPREIVAWFSPNDLYAIRKVFSSQFELRGSKVERTELIEKKTGKVLCDLTPDDIGTGAALVARFETGRLSLDRPDGTRGQHVHHSASGAATETDGGLSAFRRILRPRRALVRRNPRKRE